MAAPIWAVCSSAAWRSPMKPLVVTLALSRSVTRYCYAAMLLGYLTGPTVAQELVVAPTTDSPTYKVGDTWTFSVSTTNPGATGIHVETVVSVSENQTTLSISSKSGPPTEIDFNSQGDVIRDSQSTYDPAREFLDFPLTVGMSWDV